MLILVEKASNVVRIERGRRQGPRGAAASTIHPAHLAVLGVWRESVAIFGHEQGEEKYITRI